MPEEFNSQALDRYAYCINNPLKFTNPTGHGFFAVLALFLGFKSAGAMFTAMLIGSAIGVGMAAITGGELWKGAIAGAIGGLCGFSGNPALAMAGGALGALATGGDPMMGAMTAGIAAGVSACFIQSPLPSVFGLGGDEFLDQLILSTACGALAGGVTAEIFGGDFGQGALYGAASAAAAFVISRALQEFMGPHPQCDADPKDVDAAKDAEKLYQMKVSEEAEARYQAFLNKQHEAAKRAMDLLSQYLDHEKEWYCWIDNEGKIYGAYQGDYKYIPRASMLATKPSHEVAWVHTHGFSSRLSVKEFFSPLFGNKGGDKGFSMGLKVDAYLLTPSRSMKHYDNRSDEVNYLGKLPY